MPFFAGTRHSLDSCPSRRRHPIHRRCVEVVRALADYCESNAHHMLGELHLAVDGGPDSLADLLSSVQAHLSAALVLRESDDVDLNKHL